MKAVIVIPPSDFLDSDKVFPHLGPYYIKRYVEENSNHEIIINFNSPYDSQFDEVDIIGFSTTTPQYPFAREMAKRFFNNKITIIGGPHAHHYNLENENIWDYIINADGCKPFLNILNGKEPGNDQDNPDQLPYRDETFHEYKYFLDGNPTTVIMTARGCPNRCAFCEDASTPIRLKSPAAVKKEIQECVDLGFTGIMFFDDLFCISLKRVKDMYKVIKPFEIKFRCFAHAKNFTDEMAAILADAGCVEIGYGAEHIDQKMLDLLKKGTTVEQIYEIINIAHSYNIKVKAFLMLGLPGENNETAKGVEDFILTSGVDDFDVAIYYPYKGTEIADNIEKYDLFLENGETIGYYKGKGGYSECSVYTSALSTQEIHAWRDRIYSHNKRWKK